MTSKTLRELLTHYAGNRDVVVRTADGNHVCDVKGTTCIEGTLMLELVLHEFKHPMPFFGNKKLKKL